MNRNSQNSEYEFTPESNFNQVETQLKSSLAKCKDCSACEGRTNVVIPSGSLDAKVFIVYYSPSFIDDRTSIPLAGVSDIKASNCGICSNLSACYTGGDLIPCNFTKSVNVDLTVIQSNKQLVSKQDLFEKALRFNKNNLVMKESWSVYFDRVLDEKTRKLYNLQSQIYITPLVKCHNTEAYDETVIPECKNWLTLERKLSSAKSSIIIGNTTAIELFGKGKKPKTDSIWNNLVYFPNTELWTEDTVKEFNQTILTLLSQSSSVSDDDEEEN